jgi:hypothetical protein
MNGAFQGIRIGRLNQLEVDGASISAKIFLVQDCMDQKALILTYDRYLSEKPVRIRAERTYRIR